MTRESQSSFWLPRICRQVAVTLVAGVFVLLTNSAVAQQELALFKLADVRGQFSVRYLFDEVQNESLAATSKSSSTRLAEELKIQTRSYVYHPAFLEMLIAGSPIFVQSDYDSSSGGSKLRETLFGYNALFKFLSRKRYPFSVWFSRDHPEISTGVSGRFRSVSNEYGIGGTLRLPITVNWRALHRDAKGSGFDATVDSSNDQASLRTSLPYAKKSSLTVALNWSEQDSRSGSPGLPIQATVIESFSSELVGKNEFGSKNQFKLDQRLADRRQDTKGGSVSELDSLLYNASLRWKAVPSISAYSSYNYSDIQRTGLSQRSNVLNAGANFVLQNGLRLASNVQWNSIDSTAFDRDQVAGRISAAYSVDLPVGKLALTGIVNASRTDQESSSDTSDVFDERLVLNGIIPVPLGEEFVVEDSVIVTNVDRTQTFVRDVDYRINTIGSTTTIERLVAGNILDGQDVLASYHFLTGGTVKYGTTVQSIGANLTVSSRTSLFLKLGNSDSKVLSGISTTPLNDSRSFEVGGRSSQPFGFGWEMGGEVRYVNRDEDISPSVRRSYSVFVQSPSFWNISARFGVDRADVDYEASQEDVAATLYTLAINSRLDGGVYLNYLAVAGEDEGGSVLRKRRWHTLKISWRYRLVDFSLDAKKSAITQGATTRRDTNVTAEFRRFF